MRWPVLFLVIICYLPYVLVGRFFILWSTWFIPVFFLHLWVFFGPLGVGYRETIFYSGWIKYFGGQGLN